MEVKEQPIKMELEQVVVVMVEILEQQEQLIQVVEVDLMPLVEKELLY